MNQDLTTKALQEIEKTVRNSFVITNIAMAISFEASRRGTRWLIIKPKKPLVRTTGGSEAMDGRT